MGKQQKCLQNFTSATFKIVFFAGRRLWHCMCLVRQFCFTFISLPLSKLNITTEMECLNNVLVYTKMFKWLLLNVLSFCKHTVLVTRSNYIRFQRQFVEYILTLDVYFSSFSIKALCNMLVRIPVSFTVVWAETAAAACSGAAPMSTATLDLVLVASKEKMSLPVIINSRLFTEEWKLRDSQRVCSLRP